MEGDVSQKRFRWGLVLAWAPWLAMVPGLWSMFIGINSSKATGLAVVAGSMAEALVWWGLATLLVAELIALFFLTRSFSKQDSFRNLVSIISICASGMMLLLVGGFLWLAHFIARQSTVPVR